jgi:hypothetical protein
MEFRGIRYTIRARIERGQYRVSIHPDGNEITSNKIAGSREDAEGFARRMIKRWLEQKAAIEKSNRSLIGAMTTAAGSSGRA